MKSILLSGDQNLSLSHKLEVFPLEILTALQGCDRFFQYGLSALSGVRSKGVSESSLVISKTSYV